MRASRFAVVLGTLLCCASFPHQSFAGPAGLMKSLTEQFGDAGLDTSVIRAGYRCPRCGDCYEPRVVRRYYSPPRYEPSTVYFGPSGIYRPYPPVVVYDYPPYPAYGPYYSDWRRASGYYYYRRW